MKIQSYMIPFLSYFYTTHVSICISLQVLSYILYVLAVLTLDVTGGDGAVVVVVSKHKYY